MLISFEQNLCNVLKVPKIQKFAIFKKGFFTHFSTITVEIFLKKTAVFIKE